ncbi:DNA mismatch repair endonuclease MutL [Psychrobacter sp. KFRI-CH2-11]|uniref:DNA mismatch repair endonuclease MutL n=1 Tax=Psychrobacter sp. KFRI-CH2-11 TaxID=3156079 RepID=UPI003248EA04
MPETPSQTRIKKLPPLLVNQLAAGEVVTRPAAVVKELLENAIDAGASDIEIRVTQGGMGMIEVIDNGTGIHPDDMVMAITRHATSKIADVANLQGITTLGFRGEALAATAAVSRLTLTSSPDDSGVGRQLQVAGVLADVPTLTPVVHHRGTTITVKDLYFNVPARRSNLKSIATEFGHIEAIVRDVALARADVALSLFHDNKKRLLLSSSPTTSWATNCGANAHQNSPNPLSLSRLEQALGVALTTNALEIMLDLSGLLQQSLVSDAGMGWGDRARVHGWLWPSVETQVASAQSMPKLLYVNGRLVKEPIISNQLRQLAQSARLAGLGYALYFELPAEWLNINVHPTKQRIKISPLNNIMAHLNHAVRAKLKPIMPAQLPDEPIHKKDKRLANYNATNSHSDNRSDAKRWLSSAVATNDHHDSSSRLQYRQSSRRVSEYQQPYELSKNPDSTATAAPAGKASTKTLTKTLGESRDAAPQVVSTEYGLKTFYLDLVCLEVIHLDSLHSIEPLMDSAATNIDTFIGKDTLPWLLFYHQGQCSIVSATVWQSQLSLLFAPNRWTDSTDTDQACIATDINQQLSEIGQQMSMPDALAFKADLQALLSNHAIYSVAGSRLIAWMLSAAAPSIS